MAWHQGPLAGFDIESTGADPEDARMVQTALIRRRVDLAGPRPDTIWLINPGVEVPAEAEAIHGISTQEAAKGMDAAKATAQIRDALANLLANGVPVVIFNARYDLTVLDRECRRHDLTPLEICPERHLVVDPFVLDKLLDKYRPGSRKLEDQCRHHQVRIEGAHQAGSDALAAMRVAWRIAEGNARVAGYSVPAMMHLQASAAKEQALSLAAYFKRQGDPKQVPVDWPVIHPDPAQRQYG